MVYYSTSGQYAALLSRLDRTDLEDALCMSLQELHYDIQRQMALTDEITQQRLRPGAVSYIRQENGEPDCRAGASPRPPPPPTHTPAPRRPPAAACTTARHVQLNVLVRCCGRYITGSGAAL